MRLIDGDALYAALKDAGMVFALHMVETAPTIESPPKDAPPNDPLTLEELRELDGKPVWVVEINGYPPRWGLVYWCRKNKRDNVYVTINNGAGIRAETLWRMEEKSTAASRRRGRYDGH